MNHSIYTKAFNIQSLSNSLTASRALTSDLPAYENGDVIISAEDSKWDKSVGPPSNGNSDTEEISFTVPVNYVKNDEGQLTDVVTLTARCTLTMSVEDWGEAELTGTSLAGTEVSEQIINLTSDIEPAGIYDGHQTWGDTANVDCESGEYTIKCSAENNVMANPDYNKFVFTGSLEVKIIEGGGCPCEDCSTCTVVGGLPSPGSPLPDSLSASRSAILTWQAQNFAHSSAATSINSSCDEYRMIWSFNFGIIRGLGGALDGAVQLFPEQLSAELASPAALDFAHPLTAQLILPEEGLVPRAYLEIVQGASIIALRYYVDGTITPIGTSSYGGGIAQLVDYEGEQCLQWQDDSGSAWVFSGTTGELLCFTHADGGSITNVSDYVLINRDETSNALKQIWSYWDGLVNIVTLSDTSYSIELYTNSQISGREEDGTFTIYDESVPFKSFTLAYADEAINITESSPERPDKYMSWTQSEQGAWSTILGTGEDAIVTTRTRNELEPSVNGSYDVWQLITETSKGGVVASCVEEIYQSSLVGNLLLTRTEGYGSTHALTTEYRYDAVGNQLETINPDGSISYSTYDGLGRLISTRRPWGSGDHTEITTLSYAYSSADDYSNELATREIHMTAPDGVRYFVSLETYTYSYEDEIKRVEIKKTGTASDELQLTVEETWLGDASNPYAAGRTRMTQAVNGVQTWHEYAATSLHDASYTHTTETRVEGETLAGQSTRSITYISAEGNTTREEQYALLTDGTWVLTQGMSHSYDVQNRRVGTQYDNGRSNSRALICNGTPLWEIDENGIRTDYAYDTARTLIEISRSETPTSPETITEWTKDADGRTLTTKQFIGAMETMTSASYDTLGRSISQTDTLGRVTVTEYSEDGLTTTTTTPSGATLINRHNTDGSIAEQNGTGQRHLLTSYSFAGAELITTSRLPDGTVLAQQGQDGFGQQVLSAEATSTEGTLLQTTTSYNALAQQTSQQRGDMAPIVTSYDSFGNLIKQVVVIDSSNPDSVTANRVTEQSISFESLANGIYQVNTHTRYNAEGTALTSTQKQLISNLSELIESHSISIDERGLTSESQTCYGESLMERLQTSTVPTSDSVATATIVDGFTTAQSDQLGGSYSFTRQYTSTGITSTVTDPRGNTVTQKTDIAGRTIEQIDAAGNSTHTTYCDCCDNPASITDALGNVIEYSYDVRGRKVAENGTGIYPATYSYDDADRMISHSTYRDDQADTTSYSYDAATGFLLSTTYPDGSAETRLYNTMNLLGHLYNARGADCIHTYNTLTGDLLKQNYTDDTTDITYTYNHLGQVTSITDAAGTRTFAYNEYSQMESDTSAIDTTNIQVAESYDELGRSAGYSFIKGSETIQTVAQGYDSKGRIGSASFIHSGASKEFTYNYIEGTSLLQSLVHPNGITTTNTYEANRNLVTDINDSRSTTSVVERGYTYDELGRPITRRIARKGTVRNDSFSYDTKSQSPRRLVGGLDRSAATCPQGRTPNGVGVSQLTAATMGSDDYAYDYDNIGNRKTAQEIADEVTYNANANNQYTAISDFTPEFDLDGNQTRLKTSTGIWNVTYNAANRPTTFTSEDSNTVIECAYDYMGRRVTKKVTVDGSVTLNQRYIYRGYLQIAALDLTRTALSTLHLITWNPAEQTATRPLALQISGTWFTYGLDLSKNATESPRRLVGGLDRSAATCPQGRTPNGVGVSQLFNTAGGVETCYTYSPFGAVTEDGDTTSPIQWSSEFYDSELALVYYNYRHYNPADGRWINRDPIGIEGGLNLYGFVANSVWLCDELGLWCNKNTVGKIKITSIDANLRHSHEILFGDTSGTIDLVLDGDDIQNMFLDSAKEQLEELAIEKIFGKVISKLLQSFAGIKSKIKSRFTTKYVYDHFSIGITGDLCCCSIQRGMKIYKKNSVNSSNSTSILINIVQYMANPNSAQNQTHVDKIKTIVESAITEIEENTCDE